MNIDNSSDQMAFLPFNAINEFMRSDYRLQVVRNVLEALPGLPEEYRLPIDRLTRQQVTVPGFRNSAKAPVPIRARAISDKSFEKSPEMAAAILAAWSVTHPHLRIQVFDLLISREWELLPAEANRAQMPGFLTEWPAGETFETLNAAFQEQYPDSGASEDDISLMIVWLSGRLPYGAGETIEEQSVDREESSQA